MIVMTESSSCSHLQRSELSSELDRIHAVEKSVSGIAKAFVSNSRDKPYDAVLLRLAELFAHIFEGLSTVSHLSGVSSMSIERHGSVKCDGSLCVPLAVLNKTIYKSHTSFTSPGPWVMAPLRIFSSTVIQYAISLYRCRPVPVPVGKILDIRNRL